MTTTEVNPYRRPSRAQRNQIQEVIVPVYWVGGWSALPPEPIYFRMLVVTLSQHLSRLERYEVDSVDIVSELPSIPQFVKTLSKLREVLRVALAHHMKIPLEEVRTFRKGNLWCDTLRG